MDDAQRIVKCGNLSLHTAGGFFKKKWHNKYLVLYDGSKSGVKRLEMFDSEIKFKKQNAAKIIPLVDCVRVVTCQRNKTTYTFEVRTSEQFYLLAAQSFQDMNDWVNCLRLVAFGEATNSKQQQASFNNVEGSSPLNPKSLQLKQQLKLTAKEPQASVDVLLDKRNVPNLSNQAIHINSQATQQQKQSATTTTRITTASQALAAASSALAKTRQRQPSLLGSCKPQPPTDSPFIQQQQQQQQHQPQPHHLDLDSSDCHQLEQPLNAIGGQIDTLTPTVRGQLIGVASNHLKSNATAAATKQQLSRGAAQQINKIQKMPNIQATLDEEEENMLYCSIEDNPSEHNYRVKVIESELSLRCQLKCYQLTTPNTVSQQYDQIGNFKPGVYQPTDSQLMATNEPVTFYQLIIGPQELTLLNDYALGGSQSANKQQQGLWSWPYQCIRRYGFDKDNCFMFEAGRKCTSGPGQFIVQTPKAHSIYQDVVKFVNELRCVSGSDQQPASQAAPSGTVNENREEARLAASAVTQIPVSWAPDCLSSRQHFFDSLRQLGGHTNQLSSQPQQPNNGQDYNGNNSSSGNQKLSNSAQIVQKSQQNPPPSIHHNHNHNHHHHHQPFMHRNPATIPELCEHSSSSSTSSNSSSSSLTKNSLTKESNMDQISSKKPTNSDVTSEETDESGYEQGDDSVDSTSSRCRSSATELKGRHSLSSASSTTSSRGGSGAASGPLYSVIQRPRPAREGSDPVPPPLSRRWPPLKPPEVNQRRDIMGETMRTSNTEKLLSRLIVDKTTGRQEHDDFEANLIRDVYSEITKLHATFAVTPYSE